MIDNDDGSDSAALKTGSSEFQSDLFRQAWISDMIDVELSPQLLLPLLAVLV